MGILILIQESLSRACTRHVTPPLVTKAVEGIETTHDLQQVSSSKSWLSTISRFPASSTFRVLHNKGRVKSSTDSVNSLRSSLFALLLKLRTFSTWKILFLTDFVCESYSNFPGQAVMLCYVGETSRHFTKRVREHMSSDRSSHVYKHLQALESECRTSCNLDCFKILDSAPS